MIVRWFSYSLFHSLPLFIGPGICSKGGRISLYVKVLFTLLVDSLFAGSLSSCDGEPYGKDLRAAFRNCDHTTPKNSGSVIRHRKGRNTTMKMTNTWCQEVYFGGGKDDSARATLPEYLSLIPSTPHGAQNSLQLQFKPRPSLVLPPPYMRVSHRYTRKQNKTHKIIF